MQFDLRHLQTRGAQKTGGLLLLVYRVAAFLSAFGLPLLVIAHPPEYEQDRTALIVTWVGMIVLLGILLILLRFGKGITPAQGSVYEVKDGKLKIIYYTDDGKQKKEDTFALEELDFFHGGKGRQSSSNMASGVRISASVSVLEMGLKPSGSADFKYTLQLPGNTETESELDSVAKQINRHIANARGVSFEQVEQLRKQFVQGAG